MKRIFYFATMIAALSLVSTSCAGTSNNEANKTEETNGDQSNTLVNNCINSISQAADNNNGESVSSSTPAEAIKVKQSGDFSITLNGEKAQVVKGETVTVTFDRFPTNLADFKRTYAELSKTMAGVVVGNLMAYHLYFYNEAEGTEALTLCNDSNNIKNTIGQLSQKFSKKKISDNYCQPFMVASYLAGANPGNAYHPTKPYTVKLRMHPSDSRAPQTGSFAYKGIDYTLQIWCNGVKNEDGSYGTWRNVEVLARKGNRDFTMFNCPSLYTQVAQISFTTDDTFEELK